MSRVENPAEIEKRLRRLPEVGTILEDKELDLSDKGRGFILYWNSVIGIIKGGDQHLWYLVSLIVETLEKIKILQKKQFVFHDDCKVRPLVNARVVARAKNGKSLICVIDKINNIDEMERYLKEVTEVYEKVKEKEGERIRIENQQSEKRRIADEKAKEVIYSLVEHGFFVNEETFDLRYWESLTIETDLFLIKEPESESSDSFTKYINYEEADYELLPLADRGRDLEAVRSGLLSLISSKEEMMDRDVANRVDNFLANVVRENFRLLSWEIKKEVFEDFKKQHPDELVWKDKIETFERREKIMKKK